MRRSRREKKSVFAEINVTNIIDVTLTLLVTFIMVAPMIEHGIDVKLPTEEPSNLEVTENTVVISITKYGFVYVGDDKVTYEDLEKSLKMLKQARPQVGVLLKGDEDVEYGKVVRVLDIMRNIGISDLDIATRSPAPK